MLLLALRAIIPVFAEDSLPVVQDTLIVLGARREPEIEAYSRGLPELRYSDLESQSTNTVGSRTVAATIVPWHSTFPWQFIGILNQVLCLQRRT
jgi:hypothetical protein